MMPVALNVMCPKQILLIEDNPGDASLLEEMLHEGRFPHVLTCEKTLSGGLKRLSENRKNEKTEWDIVLADLNLPDSTGLATFSAIKEKAPWLPVVVFTGSDDDRQALSALREGAQDYLVKGQVNAQLLSRSIRYAIERQQLQQELHRMREEEEARRLHAEVDRSYQHYAAISRGDTIGEHMEELTDTYREIVFEYIRSVRIGTDRPVNRVREFAERIAGMKISARDVIRLHLGVLKAFSCNALPDEEREFSNDARLVLVEVMGNVMDHYQSALSPENGKKEDVG